jgi:pyruvate dehydrogenase E2 component (dihydrolipoamide acetyltransferase)
MATLFRMPELAANTTEAVLGDWLVAEADAFTAGDALVTVETDKANVDLAAETDGVLLRTLVPAGASVAVGTPIAVLGAVGETSDSIEAAIVGREPPGLAVDTSWPAISGNAAPSGNGTPSPAIRVFASPLARRLARDAGLDLDTLVGTGPGGRIVRRDVTAAISIAPAPVVQPAIEPVASAASVAVAAPAATSGDFVDIPHTRMRRAIATRLSESKQTVPHFYVRATCRVDKLLALRAELNAGPDRVSINDLILKAAARAHVLVPAANAIWTEAATRTFASVDISVAIATETGLVTPVLRAVDQMPLGTVAARVRDFAARARAGNLRPDELAGGSLTVTNLGMYGTEEFAAIINPPQSMILAVGAARPEPVIDDGRLAVATVSRVTLSVDHRVIDGVVAAEWLGAFAAIVESPVRALI